MPVLNEPQRRHIEVVLWSLQRTLAELEKLGAPAARTELVTLDPDLPANFSATVRTTIDAARVKIDRLVELLHISPRRRSAGAAVRAAVHAAVVRLEDCHSYKMSGFGKVDPSVAAILDPLIDELLLDFRSMAEIARS